MRYKVISMDFDGTLLTSDKKITERNRKVLSEYKNNNYIIVGITARNLSSVKSVCNIDMFNYLILNNGNYIYDVKNRKGFDIGSIDKETQIEITDYFKDIAEQIDYCSLNKYYIFKRKVVENKDYLVKINSIEEVKEKVVRMNIFFKNKRQISYMNYYFMTVFRSCSISTISDRISSCCLSNNNFLLY